jgi:hypothetical protein
VGETKNRSWGLKILYGLLRIWTALCWLPNQLYYGVYPGFSPCGTDHHRCILAVTMLVVRMWVDVQS